MNGNRWGLASALFGILLAGCGSVSDRVEQEVERELPRVIGPAERYESDVEGVNVASGSVDRVLVVGTRVRPKDGPVLERLDLDLRGVAYDRRGKKLERVESARATARVTPADLAAYLRERRGLQDAAVTLEGTDRASIRFRPQIQGFSLPQGLTVEVTGRLAAEDGGVVFAVDEVSAAGLSVGGAIARRVSDEINPVLQAADMPAGLRVTGVGVERGVLRLEAAGSLNSAGL